MIATFLNVDLGKYAAGSTLQSSEPFLDTFRIYEALALLCVGQQLRFRVPRSNGKEFSVTRNVAAPLTN
jgi:hypothetical protein